MKWCPLCQSTRQAVDERLYGGHANPAIGAEFDAANDLLCMLSIMPFIDNDTDFISRHFQLRAE